MPTMTDTATKNREAGAKHSYRTAITAASSSAHYCRRTCMVESHILHRVGFGAKRSPQEDRAPSNPAHQGCYPDRDRAADALPRLARPTKPYGGTKQPTYNSSRQGIVHTEEPRPKRHQCRPTQQNTIRKRHYRTRNNRVLKSTHGGATHPSLNRVRRDAVRTDGTATSDPNKPKL